MRLTEITDGLSNTLMLAETIQGQAGFQDDVLVLGQEGGPPLTGKVRLDPAGGAFTFKPPGSPDDVPGLEFTKDLG